LLDKLNQFKIVFAPAVSGAGKTIRAFELAKQKPVLYFDMNGATRKWNRKMYSCFGNTAVFFKARLWAKAENMEVFMSVKSMRISVSLSCSSAVEIRKVLDRCEPDSWLKMQLEKTETFKAP